MVPQFTDLQSEDIGVMFDCSLPLISHETLVEAMNINYGPGALKIKSKVFHSLFLSFLLAKREAIDAC